jgi:hypothetical protein
VVDDDEDFDPEENERQISEFIAAADDLPGPSVTDLASLVVSISESTWAEVGVALDDASVNKVIATMLWLSRESRGAPPDSARYWALSAASTYVTGWIGQRQPPTPPTPPAPSAP